jgi:hypothetical protein
MEKRKKLPDDDPAGLKHVAMYIINKRCFIYYKFIVLMAV